jgi:Domain of unknown function (DUF4430)
VRPVPLLVVAVLVAGCSSTSSGRAVVWVTRDRGAHVLHVASVPAGLTAMQGLSRVAKVESRYGGRYVRAVDGVGEQGRKAWFYYVNGYLADRSAAEYRLHAGDVEWWDFRSWRDPAQDPVVVGAFPEPFLHGYGGKRRSTVILTSDSAAVRALARRLHATVTSSSRHVRGRNLIRIAPGETTTARLELTGSTSPGSPVRLVFGGDPQVLLRRWPFRFRYSLP